MTYIKKSCILRQIKQGFSGDGKTLSGIVKIEQYAKNLSVEASIINFAPLSAGEYYCLLCDAFGNTELLPLRGKSFFNIISKLDLSLGFCAVICFVKNEVLPIAYGVNGDRQYSFKKILETAFPDRKNKGAGTNSSDISSQSAIAKQGYKLPSEEELSASKQLSEKQTANASANTFSSQQGKYDDERMAMQNYYSNEEEDYERKLYSKNRENAQAEGGIKTQFNKNGQNLTEDVDTQSILHPFATNPDGYYLTVKEEIDELFKKYPKDETLNGVFHCSEWVRVKGEEGAPEYLVGIIYEEWRAKYICYALPAENSESPPDEIKDVCTFVPLSLFNDKVGFFIIFQSAESGECIRPESV
ncbi:MAG: hypothetical protein IKA72_04810 [Clostridia bacterium]|nr:hypothetical protein [Clostridia bacterium]